MKGNSPGISAVEAGLVLGLVSIVCISMFSLLGQSTNNTLKEVNIKFSGYKPFGNQPQSSSVTAGETTGIQTSIVEETSGIKGAPPVPIDKIDNGETSGVPASAGKKDRDIPLLNFNLNSI